MITHHRQREMFPEGKPGLFLVAKVMMKEKRDYVTACLPTKAGEDDPREFAAVSS
ncbi:hypothetical protein IFO69_10520 [Echinicola sp. CAU 1574]|uniref:Uncharacterized protein n=1 Tax=Echinicola arenosa TaxID=2774144 RepID=A0ABR9AK41_9BACT|nr:hypothetical protein [Echinicola arenosa]MBD8489179.1 hypothetical protein [Echinicola arenosa]